MSEIEREPCPRCGEPAAVSGRVCPHCQGSLLVDVVLDGPVGDPRARYHLARELAAFGPPAPAFAAAQQVLAEIRPVLARGLNRLEADRFIKDLESIGLSGHAAAPFTEPTTASGGLPKLAMGLIAAVVLLLLVFSLFRKERTTESSSLPSLAPTGAAPVPVTDARPGKALTPRELAALATPATVMLRGDGRLGTGFFVGSDLVLTNAHVAGAVGNRVETVFADGRKLPGQTTESEEWLDLALVRVPGARAEPLPLGDATSLQTGDRVIFIGTPEGLDFTVHEGIVSHTSRQNLGIAYVQMDANVNPGNSGGPVLDDGGRVVGIVTAKIEGAEGLGLVLPINYTYEGDAPLLQRPEPGPDSRRWQSLLAAVAKADRERADEMAVAAGKPFLLSAAMIPSPPAILASVVRFSPTELGEEGFAFTFRKPDRIVCSVNASISTWRQVATNVLAEDPRLTRWLEKNGISRDIYMGVAHLDLNVCPLEDLSGSDLMLEGADEGADRISLR